MRIIMVLLKLVNCYCGTFSTFGTFNKKRAVGFVTFYNKFLRQCNKIGKTPTKVLLELKMGKSANTNWQAGHMPRPSTLLKLADYFGCTVDDLKSDEPDDADLSILTTFERELLLTTKSMTPAEQEQILRYAKFAVAERDKDKAN